MNDKFGIKKIFKKIDTFPGLLENHERRLLRTGPALRSTTLFCQLRNKIYQNFYPSKIAMEMCGAKGADVLRVRVIEEKKKPTHYGWWDNEKKHFCMIYPLRLQVEMCFTYGYEVAEKRGDGKLCGLRVEKIK